MARFLTGPDIRERTGLESDGINLIGQAFGGKAPKLRVNKLVTESEVCFTCAQRKRLANSYTSSRLPALRMPSVTTHTSRFPGNSS